MANLGLIASLRERLFGWLRSRPDVFPTDGAPTAALQDAMAHSDEQAAWTETGDFLDRLESQALLALGDAGLPDRLGVYGQDPTTGQWTFLAPAMSAAERWDRVTDHHFQGWRYASLPHVVQRSAVLDPSVHMAAEILEKVEACRSRIQASRLRAEAVTDFAMALDLARTWQKFTTQFPTSVAVERPSLKFIPPALEAGASPKSAVARGRTPAKSGSASGKRPRR